MDYRVKESDTIRTDVLAVIKDGVVLDVFYEDKGADGDIETILRDRFGDDAQIEREFAVWKRPGFGLDNMIRSGASDFAGGFLSLERLRELRTRYLLKDWSLVDDSGAKIELKREGLGDMEQLSQASLDQASSVYPILMLSFHSALEKELVTMQIGETPKEVISDK